jgi:hypothetical protein
MHGLSVDLSFQLIWLNTLHLIAGSYAYDSEHVFIFLFTICVSALVRCLFRLLAFFFKWGCLFYYCLVFRVLCIYFLFLLVFPLCVFIPFLIVSLFLDFVVYFYLFLLCFPSLHLILGCFGQFIPYLSPVCPWAHQRTFISVSEVFFLAFPFDSGVSISDYFTHLFFHFVLLKLKPLAY